MAGESGARNKWKKGISALRRQSTVSEPSPASLMESRDRTRSLLDEETTEAELDTYLSKLKNKSGFKNIWSGKNFEEIVERDALPDVSLSGDISVDKTKLKELHLDSDEEDLKNFIQDLSSDEETKVASDNSVSQMQSNDEKFNLMDNIQFADFNIDYNGLDRSKTEDVSFNQDEDFLPLVVQPKFSEEDSEDSSRHVYFKSKNVNLDGITSNNKIHNRQDNDKSISSANDSVNFIKNKLRSVSPQHSDTDEIEEIPEEVEDSRARTPAKSNELNYTESNFETLTDIETHKEKSSRIQESVESSSSSVKSTRKSLSSSVASTRKSLSSSSSSSSKSSKKSRSKRKKAKDCKKAKSGKSYSAKDLSHSQYDSLDFESKSDKISESANLQYKNAHTQTEFKNVQTGWAIPGTKYGLDYLDPTPIATHVVNPDSIEAITAFNPAILALNDMMKYQLQLTRQFIDNSWRLHKAYSETSSSNYRYATLESTMKYIKKNAPEVISYEEALKEVKEGSP